MEKIFMEPVNLIEEATRYNGGWTKSVTGLDKSRNNGYSILGSFMRGAGDNYTIGGLYVDCDIRGSRKNQTKNYTLFVVNAADSITVIAESTGRNWATDLWKAIGSHFADSSTVENPLAKFTIEELQAEINRRQK